MKLSIVIPSYNEAENISQLLDACNTAITRNDIEVILVNNGSTDHTTDTLKVLMERYGTFLKVVTVAENKGYGHGVLCGLNAATGDFLAITHADLQTPPIDTIRALDIIEANGSNVSMYVKGRRTGRPLSERFFSFGMSMFETIYMKTWLYDINAQPNVFHRNFYESWENPPHDFALDLFILYTAKKQQLSIHRFPTVFPPRIHGSSKWNTGLHAQWRFIKRTISFSVALKNRMRKNKTL